MNDQQARENVRQFENRFLLPIGSVDLLALFDWLRPHPERLRFYIETSRRIRADRRLPAASR